MSLRETLQRILTDYPQVRSAALESHPLAQFVRGDAEITVLDALGELGGGLIVQGSPGQGNWATVPWISVFDPAVTTSAIRGYYVVYLFHAEQSVVHLSLNQGTTAVREEFARRTRAVLADRAERNRTAARNAKKFHGTRCQACELEFATRYGDIGKGQVSSCRLAATSARGDLPGDAAISAHGQSGERCHGVSQNARTLKASPCNDLRRTSLNFSL